MYTLHYSLLSSRLLASHLKGLRWKQLLRKIGNLWSFRNFTLLKLERRLVYQNMCSVLDLPRVVVCLQHCEMLRPGWQWSMLADFWPKVRTYAYHQFRMQSKVPMNFTGYVLECCELLRTFVGFYVSRVSALLMNASQRTVYPPLGGCDIGGVGVETSLQATDISRCMILLNNQKLLNIFAIHLSNFAMCQWTSFN